MPQQWSLDRERLRVRPSPRSGTGNPSPNRGQKATARNPISAIRPETDVTPCRGRIDLPPRFRRW